MVGRATTTKRPETGGNGVGQPQHAPLQEEKQAYHFAKKTIRQVLIFLKVASIAQ
jgi:hypothetical protein